MADTRTDPQYKLRLPADLKARIEAEAEANNRSMNAEIVNRLENSFGNDAGRLLIPTGDGRTIAVSRGIIDQIVRSILTYAPGEEELIDEADPSKEPGHRSKAATKSKRRILLD